MHMKKLEDRLLEAKFFKCEGAETEYRQGYCKALDSFIEKYEKTWTLDELKTHLKEIENKGYYGSYIDGFTGCFKYLIKEMEGSI
ncbi:hypothetical protein [Metaclostridioides mangenotii]|uniref:hypothetical protein n=1 Tax=Metaclostridioides mangenotii TaxID=1540 RepID=UPI0028E628E8|nr:hypothetical protein [Clostridioides mangenotii]